MFFYYINLAYKSIKQTPIISALMLLAIAIGISVSMTFTALHQARTANPIPEKSDHLYAVQLQTQPEFSTFHTVDEMYQQLTMPDARQLLAAFSSISDNDSKIRSAASYRAGLEVRTDDKPSFLEATRVTNRDFFSLFNVPFLHGKPWSSEADQQGLYEVVIGQVLNQKVFGGGDNVGKVLNLDGQAYRVSGILAPWQPVPRFYDAPWGGAFEKTEQIFIPFSLAQKHEFRSWGNGSGWDDIPINSYQEFLESEQLWIYFWVELNTPQQKAEYEAYLESYIKQQQLSGRFSRPNAQYSLKPVMQWLEYNHVGSQDNAILMILSYLFLAVCLINTLGLLLSKFIRLAPFTSVRRALGASSVQIFYQYIVEVAVLGLLGGVFGLILTALTLTTLQNMSTELFLLAQLDWLIWVLAPAVAIVSTITTGLYPAWLVCRAQPAVYLKIQ